MTEQEMRLLHRVAEEKLKRYPGVIGVGLGLKERGGAITEEVAFRVYVAEKKDLSRLKKEDAIPPEFQGIRTDVLKVRQAVPHSCEHKSHHSPLIGGIGISPQRAPGWVGTLGFFATIDGVSGPDNIALITNKHVLGKNNGIVGDTVYQPDFQDGDTANHSIGKILSLPEIDNHSYAYPSEAAADFWIDCASAQLSICISSCCSTNCGVSFANEIRGLNVNNSNALTDVARAVWGDTVYKVGWRTSRTVGRVVDVASVVSGGGLTAKGILEVAAAGPDCDGVMRFANEGDSGAAIVNNRGQLVGLHYSAATDPTHSLNSHIHPVLDALHVTPITTANPVHDNAAAVGMIGNVPLLVDGRPSQALAMRDRLLESPEGSRIAALIEAHRQEVVHLVNHNRRVTVAWHRHQGPAFLNRAIHNARDPEQTIPREIKGITGTMLLAGMGDVLTEQGSPALRDAIGQYREEVLALAEGCDDLHALVDRLSERQPA
jgi:hypothetical protein